MCAHAGESLSAVYADDEPLIDSRMRMGYFKYARIMGEMLYITMYHLLVIVDLWKCVAWIKKIKWFEKLDCDFCWCD